MKHFIKSIFFYPSVALFVCIVALLIAYSYMTYKTTEMIITQGLREATEDVYLLKNSLEELSNSKQEKSIQRKIMLIANKQLIQRILLINLNETILYADDDSLIGKNLKDAFDAPIAYHYHHELHDNRGAHIHPQRNHIIDVTLHLKNLYDPQNDRIDEGFLIMRYNLYPVIMAEKEKLQETMIWIFIAVSLFIALLFYLYYRAIIAKLLFIDTLTSQMQTVLRKPHTHSLLLSLDDLITDLIDSTKQLTVLARVFECSNDAILITDEKRCIITVNHAFEKLTGLLADEIIGQSADILVSHHIIPIHFYQEMWKRVQDKGQWSGEVIEEKANETIMVHQTIFELKDTRTHQTTHYVFITKDLSEIMQKQREIETLSYHDKLTNLANRSSFLNTLDKLIAQKSRKGARFVLIYLDLDDFKEINDTIGYEAGDKILRYFAKRIKNSLRKEDIVARIGGDEFAIILSDLETPEEALYVARKIIDQFNKPFKIDNRQFTITTSMGIAIFPDDGNDDKKLLAAADLALHRAKENGQSQFAFFEPEMQEKALKQFQIREELKDAIKNQSFILHYQPKIDLQTQQIIGFEALIRWKHPKLGLIPPNDFIPIAEKCGVIIPMTEWICHEVGQAYDRFRQEGYTNISIAVNISAKHFQTRRLIDLIEATIHNSSIGYQHLELEVTESALMEDLETAKEQLHALHQLGIKVALDDYGTGYSSLAYLKHLPIDILKIDKSFINGLANDPKDRAIVETTIKMAHSLGMKTVAEGVEEAEQITYLEEMGCNYIQGYFYAPPLSEEDAMKLLKTYNTTQRYSNVD
jgi:diguanylate cyclase (GGDEF)-like protein/PAS domain S-box-containing protein